jgi:hypothetical protein
MGVPAKVYRDWGDIRARVVEPAIAEVNQIADFTASYRVESGPRKKVGSRQELCVAVRHLRT